MTGKTLRGYRISMKGFKIRDGKVEKISGYGLDFSKKLKQKHSKKVKAVKRITK